MASGYALPADRGSWHAHSHSYSSVYLSPGKAASPSFASSNGNGGINRQPVSHSPLFTHAESSRETSPVFFPTGGQSPYQPSPSLEQGVRAFQDSARFSNHRHSHSSPVMKSRPRGESDLGRAADSKSSGYRPSLDSIPAPPTSWFSLPEALTGMLVAVPFLLASAVHSSTSTSSFHAFPPLAAYSMSTQSELPDSSGLASGWAFQRSAFVSAGILTSGTLLVVGIAGKMQESERAWDKGKDRPRVSVDLRLLSSPTAWRSMSLRTLSLFLPFYASMLIGGSRTALILLVSIGADLIYSERAAGPSIELWKRLWASKVATSVVILLSFMADEIGLTIHASLTDLILGYAALAISILALPPPLPSLVLTSPSKARHATQTSISTSARWSRPRSGSLTASVSSRLVGSPVDVDTTLISGVLCALLTTLASTILATSPVLSPSSLLLITLAVASMAAAVFISQPSTLRSRSKAGLALGCLLTAGCSFMFSPSLWPGTVCNGGLAALSFCSVLYDTDADHSGKDLHDTHDHVHNNHTHHHAASQASAFTTFLMARCEPGSLVHTILSDKDSRRISYFTTLNFVFMLVQGAYGHMSGSLGLLSDTVHMLFDCFGLIVGLGAAVASKWPTNPDKPYGWSKLNPLAGFGNGIFLMLVSIEFISEAVEGILEGKELRHVQELFVVSTLGFLVNMVGLFAFGHAHAGHDHGHGHSHSHSHSHEKSHTHTNGQAHNHECSHGHDHGHNHGHEHEHEHGHDHSSHASHSEKHHHHNHNNHQHHHHHDHEHNDNMHGIFLHVAADAGGSLAVIISTGLHLWRPWYLWDPLATIIIAILIFVAAWPLVLSSGQKLLLVVPDSQAYSIKETLQELGELPGVVGYADEPHCWIDDTDGAKKTVIGAIHVIAAPSADLDEVLQRVEAVLAERNMNVVIHVEREAGG